MDIKAPRGTQPAPRPTPRWQRPRQVALIGALIVAGTGGVAACNGAEDAPPNVPGIDPTTTTTDPGAIQPGITPGDERNGDEDRDDPTVPTPVR